jgi:hypothetical protein
VTRSRGQGEITVDSNPTPQPSGTEPRPDAITEILQRLSDVQERLTATLADPPPRNER